MSARGSGADRGDGPGAGPAGPTWPDVLAAADRIAGRVHRTPVATCAALDELAGAGLLFKCENLQKVGAFKIRGAANAVLSLDAEEARRGVATHSSGNHAQALALAACWRGIPAHVVMPTDSPRVKREAVLGYGAEVIPCEPTLAAREEGLRRVLARTGAHFVHPYDDDRVIAGQGTAARELLESRPDLDDLVAPVGGGGLLAGTCLAAEGMAPRLRVYGAEPARADDAQRSLAAGRILPPERTDTVADGLRTALGRRNFPILRRRVADILLVEEEQIVAATRLLLERAKLVVEPSGAVPLAAVLAHRERFAGRRVGIVLSGGNLDLDHPPWL